MLTGMVMVFPLNPYKHAVSQRVMQTIMPTAMTAMQLFIRVRLSYVMVLMIIATGWWTKVLLILTVTARPTALILTMTMMGSRTYRIIVLTLFQEVLLMPADALFPRSVPARGRSPGKRGEATATMWRVWIKHQRSFPRQA